MRERERGGGMIEWKKRERESGEREGVRGEREWEKQESERSYTCRKYTFFALCGTRMNLPTHVI